MPKKRKIITLYIQLDGISPPIWRRIAVNGAVSLRMFHSIIQVAFGWANTHLHEFAIDETIYGMPSEDDDFARGIEDAKEVHDDRNITLQRVLSRAKTFNYLYDFGDRWTHIIHVEKIAFKPECLNEAIILDGQRAGPPEDFGGVMGYEEALAGIASRRRDTGVETYPETNAGRFDPESFDRRIANVALLRLVTDQWGER